MTAPIQPGEVIAGKYEVERVIGEGGMGVVVAAMHRQLNQRVAIKLLRAEGTPDADVSARFMREARAAVRLRSEHVARVLDVGTLDNNSPYIVMEYLEGEDLGAVLKRGRLTPAEAVGHILQACEALAEAHAAGIVHRDLKPENLFLTRRSDGSTCVKVLDFGISKVTEQGASNLTTTGSLMGTPLYMSPEQLRSSRQVDGRSDIWSLGMILYQLLTGQVAFVRSTLPELCTAILLDELISPRELRPELPEGLAQAVARALEKAPDDRFPSLAEFTAAITPYAGSGTVSAQRVASILDIKVEPLPALPAASRPPPPDPLGATGLVPPSALPSRAPAAAEPDVPAVPVRRLSPALLLVPVALVAALGGFLISRSGQGGASNAAPAALAATAAAPAATTPAAATPAATTPAAATAAPVPVVAVVSAPAASPAPVAPAPPAATTAPVAAGKATSRPPATTTAPAKGRPADFGSRQ